MRPKFTFFAMLAAVAVMLFVFGCEESSTETVSIEKPAETQITAKPKKIEPPVKIVKDDKLVLELKFTKGQVSKYKALMHNERNIEYAGEIAEDPKFTGGVTSTHSEIIFSQKVLDVDDAGAATLEITIESIKAKNLNRNKVSIDVDSDTNKTSVLSKLVKSTYQFKLSPSGAVSSLSGNALIQKQVKGGDPESRTATRLVSNDAIIKRHQIEALIDAKQKNVEVGDKWQGSKTVPMGLMGSNEYDKNYCYETKIDDKTALITIEGMPKAETNPPENISKAFDIDNDMSGKVLFDMSNQSAIDYEENLDISWVIVDPSSDNDPNTEPSRIKMGVIENYRLTKLN